MRGALLLVGLLVLPGCLVKDDTARDVAGKADGYYPTSTFLKVQVRGEDGHVTLADFNRTEWYVAEIAKRIDDRAITQLSAHGQLRLIGEVVVENVTLPDLDSLRYDTMKATSQQRQDMDAEYTTLLQRAGTDGLVAAPGPTMAAPGVPAIAAP